RKTTSGESAAAIPLASFASAARRKASFTPGTLQRCDLFPSGVKRARRFRRRLGHDVLLERLDAARVELPAGVPAQLLQGLVMRNRPAVGAVAGHRVEGVRDEQDARRERDVLAGQAVRVAGA